MISNCELNGIPSASSSLEENESEKTKIEVGNFFAELN